MSKIKKDFKEMVVKNVISDLGREIKKDFDVHIEMTLEHTTSFNYKSDGLLERTLQVREYEGEYTISHGTHSPSDVKSDLYQLIICGRIADRFLIENK